jgi:hypothetical protein
MIEESDIDVRDFGDVPPIELRHRVFVVLKFLENSAVHVMSAEETEQLAALMLNMERSCPADAEIRKLN